MARKKDRLPDFINPATGLRYDNLNFPVPGTGKPAWQLTPDEYVAALCYPRRDKWDEVRNYFIQIGWIEGNHYVPSNEKYARQTAWTGAVLQAVLRGETVPPEIRALHPTLEDYLAKYT